MKLPSREECLKLLKKYGVLPNILEHMLVVNKLANHLAKKLKAAGLKIDLDVVDRAALVHDIAKSEELKTDRAKGKDDIHHIIGEEILKKEGYPELGKVVRRHSLRELSKLETWEEKVVNYADTRVKHTDVVSLRERLDDLNKRYNIPLKDRAPERDIFALEEEIYDKLDEKPEDLKKVIK
jgi:putative nucleotidyltransferase with HDIG domain